MKKTLIPFVVLAATTLASCGGAASANADKALVFFNRQPSDPTTGAVDMDVMNHNDSTFYVGFDAAGGGDVQGKMITDYIEGLSAEEFTALDRNNDGKLGYVLFIGDAGHNDSKARTVGIRKALGTLKDNSSLAGDKKVGSIKNGEVTKEVVELEAGEMKNTAGATWDATTAGEIMKVWADRHTTAIDLVISNNDGMAMGALTANAVPAGVPTFGYDANADALEKIKEGKGDGSKGWLAGTISQNVDAQAIGTLQVLRNAIDGETGENLVKKGISEKDKWGNKVTPTMEYRSETKALLALNSAVTQAEATAMLTAPRDAGIKQVSSDAKEAKVLLTLYNAGDNFLSGSYKPALQYYSELMNIKLTIVEGDGQSETVVLDKFTNLDAYDAYAVNMVKTNSGADYLRKLK